MNRLFRRAQKINVGSAAALLIGATLIGQLLGFLRIKLINANFSAFGDMSTDAYFAAFKIPDFFFLTLAAGALSVAFIPVLSDRIAKGDRRGAWLVSSSLLNLLAIVMAVIGTIIFVFAEPLLQYVVAPSMTPEQLRNGTIIMRLIAFNPFLFTVAGILMGVQQTIGRFFFYALAPIIYNISIIISIFVFKDNIGIVGLGIGALVGAFAQLAIALVGMIGMGFKYQMSIIWKNNDFKKVLRNLPPRSLDQGIDGINSIVETNLARRLGEGFLSFYENAFILSTAPVLLIGTTISTAAFPRLTDRLSRGRKDLFRKDFLRILQTLIWLSTPIVIIGYFARGYLARFIFTRDAPEIALIFGFFAGFIFFRIIYSIVSRYFYAQKDTVTPLMVSVMAIILNIYLAYTLSRPTAYGIAGLAIAQSIVAAVEVGILTFIIALRDRKLFTLSYLNVLLKIASVAGFAIVTSFVMISIFPLTVGDRGAFTLGGKLMAITVPTLVVYVMVSWVFGMEEAKYVIKKIKDLIYRPVKIVR